MPPKHKHPPKRRPEPTPEKAKGQRNAESFDPSLAPETSPSNPMATHGIQQFDPMKHVPRNALIFVVGARRQGKTEQVIQMCRTFHKNKRFTHYFLFSQTMSGYEKCIPATYSFDTLAMLPEIIKRQQDVAEHNAKQKEKKDMVRSSVMVILDDMVGNNDEVSYLNRGSIMQRCACNGRHITRDDPLDDNEFTIVLISQRAKLVSPAIRMNADVVLSSRLASRTERQTVIEENLTLKSDTKGIQDSRDLFDAVTLSKPYRFVAICTCCATRTCFGDYVYHSDGDPNGKLEHWLGTEDDWRATKKRIVF